MIDVGQGDSILFHSGDSNLLIDTGGKNNFYNDDWKKTRKKSSLYNSSIEPLLKSLGIRKLNYLVITHGDMDHIGEAYELVESLKVDRVIFNKNKYNYNEKKLISMLKEKDITYSNDLDFYKLGDFYFQSLNTNLEDENDSSIIYNINIGSNNLMFMGDASKKSEEYIMSNYNLGNIDILKVGHHGSNTSTGEEFLNVIKPNIALISVGINNKFGHPNEEVIDLLDKYSIKKYLTSVNGSILINFSKSVSISLFST